MATVVSILDEDSWSSRTDIIVVADRTRQSLTWVPRDLWSPGLGDRVNEAFAAGGNERLIAVLAELGFHAEHALCLRRSATERALAEVVVDVPVHKPLDFWYPLHPNGRIEEGRKRVSFRPPVERLSGERIHQWIGARYGERDSSDLHRIARQQVFLRELLNKGFDFEAVIRDPDLVRISDETAIGELRRVNVSWEMITFKDVRNQTIDGKMVLVAGR